ncbi:DUF2848 family protein [Hydrogenibacillus sp. N12]|uniref:DUF2848 family protein n=1 Tax=Hydrogenibacillus sp. N12 TaxID=2866627 RepID=UPI001C7E0DC1|nr:DUF2848 family protein [Hydrogenibacillus sp. N12]QZA32903.1 DUF2848 domain-containing protein [Hydrogenibacillus sp. N12]
MAFQVQHLVLGGFSGRNTSEVMNHIEELEKIGVQRPPQVPMLYPVSRDRLKVDDKIQVLDDATNGEVEYVLFVDKEILYVTVGSDHTDRDLEKYSVRKSKQMYPNIIPRKVWRYEDVKDHELFSLCLYLGLTCIRPSSVLGDSTILSLNKIGFHAYIPRVFNKKDNTPPPFFQSTEKR